MENTLKQYWGYDSFRPFQKEIIAAVMDGRDVVAILPTGGGKSLCYQLPALLKDGLTIVISPLISLIEAHCISQWGHDFRPEYRALATLRQQFPLVPIAAFTATATPDVTRDITTQLNLLDPHTTIGSIDRSNLVYRVYRRDGLKKQITTILDRHRDEPGIIYCLRRKDVDTLSAYLNEHGYRNLPYHAGMDDAIRKEYQMQFAREEVHLVVATIAFGMGIDRSNVRLVIHAAMPGTIEQYQQETGRAGRDGLPAYCYLFFGPQDYYTRLEWITDGEHYEVMRTKLNTMYDFCTRPQCRHQRLVTYFGQSYGHEHCNACDVCLEKTVVPRLIKPLEAAAKRVVEERARTNKKIAHGDVDTVLFERLRERRKQLARAKNVPAFIILSDRSLRDMAIKRPRTVEEFANVFGIGTMKRAEYAAPFLEELNAYARD